MDSSKPTPSSAHFSANLTAREFEVLVLIAEGKTTREIGEALGITFKTAACHRQNILGKFGVRNTVLATRTAIRLGLIQA